MGGVDSHALVKVLMRGPGGELETLWAEPVGDGHFRLDNAPFFAYGVSADDIVAAEATEHEGVFEFRGVVRRAGNRTVRLAFVDEGTANRRSQVLARIVELGCSYEGANPNYIAITVPGDVDLDAVVDTLQQTGMTWEYADPPAEA
ncbi:MAG: DUF4265 domain-containing protein [Actinomycetota bacterium]|nr:DUF4265 domain-containing protein [Actinomycetota bacterium]